MSITKTIKYNSNVSFLGRNGDFDMSALNIHYYPSTDSPIELTPNTGKGIEGRCSMEIPVDKLNETIEALTKLRDYIVRERMGVLEHMPD